MPWTPTLYLSSFVRAFAYNQLRRNEGRGESQEIRFKTDTHCSPSQNRHQCHTCSTESFKGRTLYTSADPPLAKPFLRFRP